MTTEIDCRTSRPGTERWPWRKPGVLAVLTWLAQAGCGSSPDEAPRDDQRIAAVAAGAAHTCILTRAGGVWCFGDNHAGQLGDGTTTATAAPVAVSGLARDVIAIAAGWFHTCALTRAGAVKCWGGNTHGQLGDGGTDNARLPVDVSAPFGAARAIAAGGQRSCALAGSGDVWCWGFGSFGNGVGHPELVGDLPGGAASVTVGTWHACALLQAGTPRCWGVNGYKQLGAVPTWISRDPVEVPGLSGTLTGLAAGDSHTCALNASGSVACWGGNYHNQLGDGTETSRANPAPVEGLGAAARSIASGAAHTCARLANGAVQCWGRNTSGQLGTGTQVNAPVASTLTGIDEGVVAIAAGGEHTCAVTASGSAICWGSNGSGELGNGSMHDSAVPVAVGFPVKGRE